jgi:transcriptional regulator GlxA family with amidase domain
MSGRLESLSARLAPLDRARIVGHLSGMAVLRRVRATPWSSETDREELYVCLAGSAVLERAGRSVSIGRGDLVLACGSTVALRAGEGLDALVARFDGVDPAFVVIRSNELARAPEIATLARLLRAELAAGVSDARIVRSLAESLAIYARRVPALGMKDRRISPALEAMSRDPARRWTIVELARVCGLSRAAFNRRFAAAIGTSPLRHLYLARMDLAARRLVESDDSLAAIAAEIGYESEFAFGKAFKRRFGVPPGTYRRSSAPVMRLAA